MTRTYTQHLKTLLKLTNNKKPSITINMTSLPSDAALAEQLIVARNEIQNLRNKISALSFTHRMDIKNIKDLINNFQCQSCKANGSRLGDSNIIDFKMDKSIIPFKPIGLIRTEFAEKRAVPRQPTVCPRLQGCIELSRDVFNNPEHSLDGLHEYSHLWIIYHFHRNDSHAKAKVAPPRLGGERVGIFSTRSPHRPCPIGLSLVEIDRIDGSQIFFFGTDMVDNTPVLDIKPYIPRYDNPFMSAELSMSMYADDSYGTREEPDGEEADMSNGATALTQQINATLYNDKRSGRHNLANVRVPNWVTADSTLSVTFNERAEQQMSALHVDQKSIVDILQNDPRSVYLRTRYGSQIFTFQLGEVTVTCKFDDAQSVVNVLQVRVSENLANETN